MLQVIKDALYCHIFHFEGCPDYIAESILQSIEGGNHFGEGMRPPYNSSQDDGVDTMEWEPE